MELIALIVISVFGTICATDSQIDRQNDNYESLNRYRPIDSSSYGQSGGYYPRTPSEQFSQNRLPELSGREFRPPNVFLSPLLSAPSPYMSPLLAQQRQYFSYPGASGPMSYQMNGLQSSGYGGPPDAQYSGYNYGGIPSRLGLGETLANAGQGYGYGNFLSNPFYGIGSRQAYNQPNPFSIYGGQGLHSSPYSQMSYPTPGSGYLNQSPYGSPYGSPYMGSQFSSNPYPTGYGSQSSQMGYNSGYNSYNNNNYNGISSNSALGSGQSGSNEGSGVRDERSYASSASTQTETQTPNETPIFHSNRITKRTGDQNLDNNKDFLSRE